MGCQCCKGDDEDQRKQSVVDITDQFSKERLQLNTGTTNLEVKNCALFEVNAMAYVGTINSKGRSPKSTIIQKHDNILEQLKLNVREEEGELKYGDLYPTNLVEQQKAFFIVLPLWKGGHKNESQHLEEGLHKLVKEIQQLKIESICLDEIGVKYFGYPRQIVIECVVNAFSKFFREDTYLRKIFFTSCDMTTVNMFEVNLKRHLPKQEKEIVINKTDSSQKSDMERPLLGE